MSTYRRLLGFLFPYKGLVSLALIAMVILAVTTAMYPILIDLLTTSLFGGAEALNALVGGQLGRVAQALSTVGLPVSEASLRGALSTNLFILFGIVVLAKAFSQALRFYAMGAVAQKVIADVRHQLFSAIVGQSRAFFGDQATGFLVSRVINDVALVERAATYAIPVLFGDVLKVLSLAFICLWQYGDLVLVSFVVLPLAAFPIVQFGKLLKRYARQGQEALGGLTNRVTESLGGMEVIQVYGREAHEVARFDGQSDSYVQTMLKSVLVRALQTPVMELVGVGALIGTMAYAQWRIESGSIRPGEVVAFLIALVLMYEPLKAIGRLNGIIQPGIAAAERVFEIVDRPNTIESGATELSPMTASVEFSGVSFRYPGAAEDAVDNLTLSLARGKVVALVGPSGSGKSTVAALVPRLYDVTEGKIAIDGVDVRDATLSSLRGQIAVVSQETYLFNDTIRANIAYGRPEATAAQIEEAARAAFAHDFIVALPDGYDTVAGERAVQLSGGQRQRIAIARAFLRDAPILILDEATSALDNESEREVQRALDALVADRTALVIAHRLSTVKNADEIVVLDRGQVVERGTHATLVAAGNLYTRLTGAGGALDGAAAEPGPMETPCT